MTCQTTQALGVFAAPGKGLRARPAGVAPHWGSGASATYECAHNSYMSCLVYNETHTHTRTHTYVSIYSSEKSAATAAAAALAETTNFSRGWKIQKQQHQQQQKRMENQHQLVEKLLHTRANEIDDGSEDDDDGDGDEEPRQQRSVRSGMDERVCVCMCV